MFGDPPEFEVALMAAAYFLRGMMCLLTPEQKAIGMAQIAKCVCLDDELLRGPIN